MKGWVGLAGTWPKAGREQAAGAGPLQEHGRGGEALPGACERLGRICGR
jgi:hypothetical protein